MPYIPFDRRDDFKPFAPRATSAGELTYQISCLIKNYLGTEETFSAYARVVGVLQCLILELYRVKVGPYEEGKRQENGDVW